MKWYRNYAKEAFGKDCYEFQYGFIIYEVLKSAKEFHVADLYILPEYRKTIHVKKMIEGVKELARRYECAYISSCVNLQNKTADEAVQFNLRAGFHLFAAQSNVIWFKYEL
jgi:ribosomal protein S18 acetylase RimI-like enzyme